jgi:hypothetical protein
MHGTRTVALLPATMALFDRKKGTIADIAGVWGDRETGCTVQVMELDRVQGRYRFVVGSGVDNGEKSFYDPEFDAHHDQNFSTLGHLIEVGRVCIKNGEVISNTFGDRINTTSAPIWVYK